MVKSRFDDDRTVIKEYKRKVWSLKKLLQDRFGYAEVVDTDFDCMEYEASHNVAHYEFMQNNCVVIAVSILNNYEGAIVAISPCFDVKNWDTVVSEMDRVIPCNDFELCRPLYYLTDNVHGKNVKMFSVNWKGDNKNPSPYHKDKTERYFKALMPNIKNNHDKYDIVLFSKTNWDNYCIDGHIEVDTWDGDVMKEAIAKFYRF